MTVPPDTHEATLQLLARLARITPALSQARAELAAEIRAAREEAATAPLYRSGPR